MKSINNKKLTGMGMLFAMFLIFLAACTLDNAKSQEAQVDQQEVTLSVTADIDSGRSALPNVTLDNLNSIVLYYLDASADYGMNVIGSWSSYTEMVEDTMSFKTGTYKFVLIAMAQDMLFTQQKTFTIGSGSNRLSFNLAHNVMFSDKCGKGGVDVVVRYSSENVAKVVGGLYSVDGDVIPGYTPDEVEIGEGGVSEFVKSNVPAGYYLVMFHFYADDAKKLLIGSCREYVSVVNDLTSDTECSLDAMSKIFDISYNLNGGSWKNGYVKPEKYTRLMSFVTLPTIENVTKTDVTFDGWYDNAAFKGNAITGIPGGSTGNKTFYAKWTEQSSNVTIEFNYKNSVYTQTVKRNVETMLATASTIGLVNPSGKRFVGWSDEENGKYVVYSDGSAVKINSNLTLYAVYAESTISDDEDTDNDGLSDWYEVYKSLTDPMNPDTDGDAWRDPDELNLFNQGTLTFSPLIADVPLMEVSFGKKPVISYIYETNEGSSVTEEIRTNEGTTQSLSNGNSNSKSRVETHGWSFTFGGEYKFGSATDSGLTLKAEANYNGNIANGDEYTYSTEMSNEYSKEWSNSKSSTSDKSKSLKGGKIVIQARFKNPSNIAYDVEHATIAISRIPNNTPDALIPITNIKIENVGVIGPGSQSGMFNVSAELTIEETENLLKWSNGLSLSVSGYNISMDLGGSSSDFTDSLTRVKAQTAAVYIDWGVGNRREAKTYNVAVKNLYKDDATSISDLYDKPSLKYIFDNVLHYTENTDYVLSDGMLYSFYGIENEEEPDDGSWFISHKFTQDGVRVLKLYSIRMENGYNIDNIKISAGDEVSVIYCVDKDGDGVPFNEELIYGTSDATADSDGDGLTDFEEIYGWYKTGLVDVYEDVDGKRVCTDPSNKDTDGDDLLDWSEIEEERDIDPLSPKLKDDTRLGDCYYRTNRNTTRTLFTFDENKKASISAGASEYIYLDVKSKVAFGVVRYKTDEHAAYNEEVDRNTPIPLRVGTNTIYIECTAPDGITKLEYTINVTSDFIKMKNFKLSSPELQGGKVVFTWDSYTDERANASDGGYILYARKGSFTCENTLERNKAVSPTSDGSNLDGLGEFCKKLDSSTLSKGSYTLTGIKTNQEYTFGLYAYAHVTENSTYKSILLNTDSNNQKVKSSCNLKGKLTFYAHYIEDRGDSDGAQESSEYYWSFTGNTFPGLESFSCGRNSHIKMDNGGEKKYWCFGEKSSHSYNPPEKIEPHTWKSTVEFERNKDYSFTIEWKVKECDNYASTDDYLGTEVADFKYDRKTDTWTCSWKCKNASKDNPGSSTIKAGERDYELEWYVQDNSNGKVRMLWGWEWE